MKVTFYLSIGFPGAVHEETFDTDEDLGLGPNPSEKELDQAVQDWINNYLDYGYRNAEP